MSWARAVITRLLDRVRHRHQQGLSDLEIRQASWPLGSVDQILPFEPHR